MNKTSRNIILSLAIFLLISTRLRGSNNGGTANPDNLRAFLKMIQWAEGTLNQPNPYAVTFAYSHIIKNFSDHPAITGEWDGHPLSDSLCRAAGVTPPCVSTAAGAYQFLRSTWSGIKGRIPGIRFDRDGQDMGATDLIDRKNALEDVLVGNLASAINKCNTIWASLPGSPYGQPVRTYAQCEAFYLSQGGRIFSI